MKDVKIKDKIIIEILKNYKFIEGRINIIKYLISFNSDKGTTVINITHEHSAEILNCTRETINKHLKRLERENAITPGRGFIMINDKKLLLKKII